ncbi:MAG: S1 RNA-binding domain-containing protein [Minisyncoccia bacterium]
MAKVLVLENEDGYVELSLTEAGKQKNWQKIKELEESGEVISMKIIGANSGGLIGEIFEIKAFLPVSKLSEKNIPKETDRQKMIEELKKFIGQELNVKIALANPRNNKLIVSERETVSANVLELLEQYKPGQIVEAVVSGMASFGVFVKLVDNPQVEGVVYLSELDYKIIDNPKDILNLNDIIKVKILDIKDGKLILSAKAAKEDPWQKVEENYKVGNEVYGTVYKFTPFGAIINLNDLQGVVHITDFGSVEEMQKELTLGEKYNFIVHQIKPEERRLILKLKK